MDACFQLSSSLRQFTIPCLGNGATRGRLVFLVIKTTPYRHVHKAKLLQRIPSQVTLHCANLIIKTNHHDSLLYSLETGFPTEKAPSAFLFWASTALEPGLQMHLAIHAVYMSVWDLSLRPQCSCSKHPYPLLSLSIRVDKSLLKLYRHNTRKDSPELGFIRRRNVCKDLCTGAFRQLWPPLVFNIDCFFAHQLWPCHF